MKESPGVIGSLERVSKRYGDTVALDGLDLELRRGEVLALLGPNGAGKTTSVRLMTGLDRPDIGEVHIFGGSPRDIEVKRRVGVMLQLSGLPENLRVGEHLDLFSRYYGQPIAPEEVLRIAGLTDLVDRPYRALSGGQQRRVQFALAICGDPELLFLDEPTAGLDVESRRGFWAQIRRLVSRGTAIVLTTHYLEEADALADRVVVIDRGKTIASGSPEEIRALGGGKRIGFRTDLDRARLAGLPGVTSVVMKDDRAELVSGAVVDTLRALLAIECRIDDLEVTGARLEDAFLNLTRGDQKEVAA